MQFIPSTWSVVGVDADGDGQRNPQDIDDAALGTAVYLCSGDDDLASTKGQRGAVYRYNHSSSYVDLVLSIMNAYLDGEFTSVPNGTTSAGYVVPAPAPVKQGGHHHNNNGNHHQPTGQQSGDNGGDQPTEQPTEQPTRAAHAALRSGHSRHRRRRWRRPAARADADPAPLPSTSIEPVDQVLTQVQAIAQCTLEGYVDNILKSDDPFDKCVYRYTH